MSDTITIDVSTTIQNVDVFLSGLTGSNVNVDVIYPAGPIGPIGPIGPQGINTWGSIYGDLSAQTDLWSYLSAGVGLNTTALNDYLSTNNIVLSSATILSNLFVGGSSTFSDTVSVGGDLYVDGTLYTTNTAIVLGTYYETIGDGSSTTFSLQHDLGTQDVHVVVRDLNTNLLVFPAIEAVDTNNVNLSFSFAPSLTSYSVSIFAGVPSNKISAFKEIAIPPERPIANTFYVSVSGNDNNSGTEIYLPLRTIKKACQKAHNARVLSNNNPNVKFTILVGTGDYYEDNPIYVAPNTSIIGDNLRRVSVFPNYPLYDMFWLDNSTYVWGFTFRGHQGSSAVTAFPNYTASPAITSIALSGLRTPYVSPGVFKWRKPYITTSPYVQGSSSITSILKNGRLGTASWVPGTSATWAPSARNDVSFAMDSLIGTLAKGLSSIPYSTWTATSGAISAANILLTNENFIKKETTGFINAQYRGLVYDVAKCERDIGYALSAVRADIVNGNNGQALYNGNFYWQQNVSEVTNGKQRAATITAYEFVKNLALQLTTTPNIEPPYLYTGCGMRVDGSLAEGFLRSMVLDSYTQFNEGGKGIHILNNGYAQLVSIFTICCTEGMLCESGGSCSISNSNCSFGLSGLVARGKSPSPILSGTLVNFVANPEDPFVTTTLLMSGITGLNVFPNSDYFPALFNTPGVNLDTRKIAYAPYDGLVFNFDNGTDFYTINGSPLSSTPGSYSISTLERINNALIIPGTKINFYLKSTIYASSHTFEFVGTGILLRNSVPALGGVSTPETEVIFNDTGAVYYTSTNHTGDFSIGEEFRVVQSTGTIEGNTFKRSILTLVTPLNLALE